MGIYITKQYEYDTTRDGDIMHVSWDTGYGEVVVETWVKICEIRDRQTCFCCSCGERTGSDPACRNHGFAAERPCELHVTEGSVWGEEMCINIRLHNLPIQGTQHREDCSYGKMPKSVQAIQLVKNEEEIR